MGLGASTLVSADVAGLGEASTKAGCDGCLGFCFGETLDPEMSRRSVQQIGLGGGGVVVFGGC